jgi:hypothetical protein
MPVVETGAAILHLHTAAAPAHARNDLIPVAWPTMADDVRARLGDSQEEIGNSLVVGTHSEQSIAQHVPHDRNAQRLTRKNQAELHVHC